MIKTPKGLTIYLDLDYSFALMARLYPEFDAFYVLEKTQGINKIHNTAGFIIGIVCFILDLSPLIIAVLTFSVTIVFFLMRLYGIFIIPGMVVVSTYYGRFMGYGIFLIILLLTGLFTVGIIGTLAFAITRLLVEGITVLIDMKSGENVGKIMGVEPVFSKAGAMYYAPIKDFLNAYKLTALKTGFPINGINYEISEEELMESNWIHIWKDFELKCPIGVQRYIRDGIKIPN